MPTIRYVFNLAVFGLAYFVTAKLGLTLSYIHPSASSVWAPTGIAIATFTILGFRYWPGAFIAAFTVNYLTAGSWATSLGIAAGNTLEGLVGAALITQVAGGRKVFETPQNVLRYMMFVALGATTISPTMGTISLALAGYAPWAHFAKIWLTWWLGDASGALIMGPFLILWADVKPFQQDRWRTLEWVALLSTVFIISRLVFDNTFSHGFARYPIGFICIPMVIWAAYRFGAREVATATLTIAVIAIWGTVQGSGLFAQRIHPGTSLVLLQCYLATMAVTGLILASLVAQRRRSEDALRQANESLELRVQERTLSLARTIADLKAISDARRRVETNLKEIENRYELLVATVKDYAIYLLDAEGRVATWNEGAQRIKGYSEEEIIGHHYSVFFTPEDRAAGKPQNELLKARTEGRAQDVGQRLRKDGTRFWADVSITALFDKQGNLRGFAKVTRDISERRKVEEALRASETRFRQLVDSNIIGFMILDEAGRVIEANDALLSLLNYTQDDVTSNSLYERELTPESFRTLDQWAMERLQASGTCPPVEKEFSRKDGVRVPVLVGMVLLHKSKGHRVCFVIDVSERRSAQDALRRAYDELELRVQQRTIELQEEIRRREHAEEELRNQAIRDALTGLYNRRGFMMLAGKHLELAQRQQRPLVLFMADLDDLKPINDHFGHAEGDRALSKVAEIMSATFRQSDIVARIGGDEFAVAGIEEHPDTEADLVQRLQKALEKFNAHSGWAYNLRVSVGTARLRPDQALEVEQGMQQADTMLYEQKKQKNSSPLKVQPYAG